MDSSTGDPVWRSNSPTSRIALIAALELEARIPKTVFGAQCPSVYISGPGRERAYLTASHAIAEGAEALVSWGLAGGLSAETKTGAVILPGEVISETGSWPTDIGWRQRLADALDGQFPLVQQPLYSAEQVLTSPQSKSVAATRFGASAVDMESAGIAAAALEHGVSFVVLRVIADGPVTALPDNVEALVTSDGHTRYFGLLGVLISPRRLRLLVGLARSSQHARRQLALVAEALAGSVR
jgi:hypothetical protein